jgi:hypothetical protein
MQRFFAPILIVTAHGAANPMNKVVELLDGCRAKVVADGEAEAKAYKEYVDWCDDTATGLRFDVKTGTASKAKLEAKIGKLRSDISVGTEKVEDLTGAIAADDSELKAATGQRAKESADFAAAEAELVDGVDFLNKAIGHLERERAKGNLGLAQIDTSSLSKLTQSMSVVMTAAGMNGEDKAKLKAFLQSRDDDDDDETGAPAAATYVMKETIPVEDVLRGMKEKVEGELADLRKVEAEAKHSFGLLKGSLEVKMAADTKDLHDEKSAAAEATQGKSQAEGDLSVTTKDLAVANDALAATHRDCLTKAADYEASIRARAEELKVIATAKKILQESTGAAVSQSYSLLQVSIKSNADLKNMEVVASIEKLAKEHKDVKLAQLASKVSAVISYGGPDVFKQVKEMILQDIEQLKQEAEADATEKSYCDEEMAKTEEKKAALEPEISKLVAKIDQAASLSAQIKEEATGAQTSLAAIAKSQVEMDMMRQQENAVYKQAKADLEQGIAGVEKARAVLRDYYGGASAAMIQQDNWSMMQQPAKPVSHSKSSGTGSSIINLLEIVESDFSKDLADEESAESDAQEAYDKQTQENKIQKTMKDQDVKYKTQEFKSLDAEITELTSDKRTSNEEHASVMQYYAQIKDRCVAKASTFDERSARRQEEIEGLKESLEALDEMTAFAQMRKRRGGLKVARLG